MRTRLARLLEEYAIYIVTHCLGGTRSLLGDFRRPKLPGVLDNVLGTRLDTEKSVPSRLRQAGPNISGRLAG
jgi:hypothetical protein